MSGRPRRTLGMLVLLVTGLGVVPGPAAGQTSGASSSEGISGTVTEAGSGSPLPGICVEVFYAEYVEAGDYWALILAGSAESNGSGQYTVLVPPRNDNLVSFRDLCDTTPHHVGEWYQNQPTWETANPVTVNAGSITPNIDAALALGGAISGAVTAEENAQALSGICVALSDGTSIIRSTVTDSSGNYLFDGVPAATYKVRFGCPGGPDRVLEWYADRATEAAADPVAVTAGTTATAIDAALALQTYALSVTSSGTGTGTVTSSPAGIDCGADCSETYTYGTVVTLTATPAAGSTFVGWAGGCSGLGLCTVTMNDARTVQALFDLIPPGIAIADATALRGTPARRPRSSSSRGTGTPPVRLRSSSPRWTGRLSRPRPHRTTSLRWTIKPPPERSPSLPGRRPRRSK